MRGRRKVKGFLKKIMEDRPEQESGEQKKSYVKPEVSKVQLTPQEAVLGGCKTITGSGPLHALCTDIPQCGSIEIS